MPWIKVEHVCRTPHVNYDGEVTDSEYVDYNHPRYVGQGSVWECGECGARWKFNANHAFERLWGVSRLAES